MPQVRPDAPGRLKGEPVAIVDIGSNSVRLVAYEALTRAPTPIFNEKVLCGLGRGVVTTRRLPQDGVEKALMALRRFRVLCRTMGVSDVRVLATAAARRPLLAYGAVVLEEIIRKAKPKEVVLSAAGVREGLLYERLSAEERALDPLLTAAHEFNVLRSRAPQHGEDLCAWTDAFMTSTHIEETEEVRRLRHAACLLGDIGWRAHPDYRGEQALNIIANASFIGVDHPGRAFLALATSYRHLGIDEDVSPQIRALVSARALDRARLLGAAMRVAYIVTAAMPDVLKRTPMLCDIDNVTLHLPPDFADLGSDRLQNRLKQLGRLIGRGARIEVG